MKIGPLVPDRFAPPPGRDVRFTDGVARRHAWAAREVRQIEFRYRCRRIGAVMAVGVAAVGVAAVNCARAFTDFADAYQRAELDELETFVTALDTDGEPR